MSEPNTGVVESEQPTEQPAPPPVAPPAEEPIPEAVEVAPGQHMVPVGVIKAMREEMRHRPKQEDYARLQAELEAARPYVDFIKSNPGLTQPAPVAPPAPVPIGDDPELITLAKTLELYDAATGQPDVKRAEVIRGMTRKQAEAITEERLAPVQERTHEQAAAANLQQVMASFRDADGRPLDAAVFQETVKGVVAQMSKADALKLLADPRVVQVLAQNAIGAQAMQRKSAPPAPAAPPLYVEGAGGGQGQPVMSEGSKRLARLTGRTEKDWVAAASRYVPGKPNSLETD